MSTFELDKKTALVLIDLQNGIVGIPTVPHNVELVVANGVRLAEAFRARGLPAGRIPSGSFEFDADSHTLWHRGVSPLF